MSIAKPFTFTPNTYAKSSEVNQDFDVLYSQVNTNISNIAQNATDIDNLDANKANINGSSSQRFAVADPVVSGDAINKGYLESGNLTLSGDLTFSGSNTFSGDSSFSGDMTFTGGIQMPDSDSVGSAITTKAISKSGNGYLKMGNGIIIVWGGYAQSSSGSHSVSFPTAFTAVPKLTTQILLNTNGTLYQPLVKSVTKTGFTYYTTHANEFTLMYVAVGY